VIRSTPFNSSSDCQRPCDTRDTTAVFCHSRDESHNEHAMFFDSRKTCGHVFNHYHKQHQFSRFDTIHERDRRTDGQTDGQTPHDGIGRAGIALSYNLLSVASRWLRALYTYRYNSYTMTRVWTTNIGSMCQLIFIVLATLSNRHSIHHSFTLRWKRTSSTNPPHCTLLLYTLRTAFTEYWTGLDWT